MLLLDDIKPRRYNVCTEKMFSKRAEVIFYAIVRVLLLGLQS